jgi:hypothetical protein
MHFFLKLSTIFTADMKVIRKGWHGSYSFTYHVKLISWLMHNK